MGNVFLPIAEYSCKPLHLFWLSFSSSSSLYPSSSFSLQILMAKKNSSHLLSPTIPMHQELGNGLVGQFWLAATHELQSHAGCNSSENFTGTGGLTSNVLTHMAGMLMSASRFHFIYMSSSVLLECLRNMAAGFPQSKQIQRSMPLWPILGSHSTVLIALFWSHMRELIQYGRGPDRRLNIRRSRVILEAGYHTFS